MCFQNVPLIFLSTISSSLEGKLVYELKTLNWNKQSHSRDTCCSTVMYTNREREETQLGGKTSGEWSKEALDSSVKALIHHLITSAVCTFCVFSHFSPACFLICFCVLSYVCILCTDLRACESHAWVALRQMLLFACKCFLRWSCSLHPSLKICTVLRFANACYKRTLPHGLTEQFPRQWTCIRINGISVSDHVGRVIVERWAEKLREGAVQSTLRRVVDNAIQKYRRMQEGWDVESVSVIFGKLSSS